MHDRSQQDVQSDEEFARQVMTAFPQQSLWALVASLKEKRRWMLTWLSAKSLSELEEGAAISILEHIFGTRRRARAIASTLPSSLLGRQLADLLYGSEPLSHRFNGLCNAMARYGLQAEAIDLAGECLHWLDPHRYWLWTRWVWNPSSCTGALRLLVADWHPLLAPTPGDTYLRVGEAVAYAEATRQSLGFLAEQPWDNDSLPLAVDLYLAVAYTLYFFMVLNARMSREFTRMVPQPWELIHKLLGLYPVEAHNA